MAVSNRARTGERATKALAECLPPSTRNVNKIVQDLYDLGYIIVPKLYDKPARRGNEAVKPPEIWIGKSHSKVLAGG